MKKLLRKLIILIVIVCIFLLIQKNTTRLGTTTQTGNGQTGIVSTGIDLTNCISYFDGCNNCSVKDGKADACTLMYCETPTEPKCLQYATGTEVTGDVIPTKAPTNLSTYSDTTLNITFSYPKIWGTITTDSENNANGTKYLVSLSKKGSTFLVFHNGKNPPARGSFRGDEAKDINSNAYINTFCANKTNCTLRTNMHGIPYVKYNEEYGELGSSQTKIRLMYYLFNPNSSFRGIILSNDAMSNEPEANLDALIESISFN